MCTTVEQLTGNSVGVEDYHILTEEPRDYFSCITGSIRPCEPVEVYTYHTQLPILSTQTMDDLRPPQSCFQRERGVEDQEVEEALWCLSSLAKIAVSRKAEIGAEGQMSRPLCYGVEPSLETSVIYLYTLEQGFELHRILDDSRTIHRDEDLACRLVQLVLLSGRGKASESVATSTFRRPKRRSLESSQTYRQSHPFHRYINTRLGRSPHLKAVLPSCTRLVLSCIRVV
jgi:hypothetical protein